MLLPRHILSAGGTITGFHPSQIKPAPIFWVDAVSPSVLFQTNGGSAATVNNDPIGQWKDISGFGNDLFQATAGARFRLRTAIQNGMNVVECLNGHVMVTSSSPDLIPNKRCTFFCVSQVVTGGVANQLLGTTVGTGTQWTWRQTTTSNQAATWGDSVSTKIIDSTATESTIWNVHTVSRTGNTTLIYHRNGINMIGATIANDQPSTNPLAVGGTVAGLGSYQGYFAEIICFDRAISSVDIALVERWLANKWGITLGV
jgi:hypothetical protein